MLRRIIPSLIVLVVCVACGGPRPAEGDRPPQCGDGQLVFDPRGDVVSAHDDALRACVRLERRPESLDPGAICKACPYVPLRLTAAIDQHFVDVTDAAQLEYTPTHHNWQDEMRGTDAAQDLAAQARLLYVIDGGGYEIELTIMSADQREVLAGPVTLTPEGQLD